jgi:small subunit ribosomal protein S14
MARNSNKARATKRKRLQDKFAEVRAKLRAESKAGDEEAIKALQELPRDSSYIRDTRRCNCCGRPRATLRRFGVCRICLRKLAMSGFIPGVRKSSW